jgi:hypothetical protein
VGRRRDPTARDCFVSAVGGFGLGERDLELPDETRYRSTVRVSDRTLNAQARER